jgi:hypothetical protein
MHAAIEVVCFMYCPFRVVIREIKFIFGQLKIVEVLVEPLPSNEYYKLGA